MFTYKDLKIDVLQKIGESRSIQNNSIVASTSVNNYISQIPNLLREGLQILSTAGKYIVKYYDIINNPIVNGLPDADAMRNIFQVLDENIEFELKGAKSYYFEVFGKGTAKIYVGEELYKTIVNEDEKTFNVYKGNIVNENDEIVKLVFEKLFPYSIQNIALYQVTFETDEKVFDNVANKRYDLKKIISDFYKLKDDDMPYQSGLNLVRYENNSDYHWEGDRVLVLDNDKKGMWRVYYYAYPQNIDNTIQDTTELELDPEVIAILPLYIAGQLLMAEDEDYSTERLNEFEERRLELMPNNNQPASFNSEFENVTGW